jgi:hypothetical protein
MHEHIKVKSPNNTSKWQMGFNSAFKGLISTVLQTDVWPISKETLIRKHFKIFVKFTKEISFDKLNDVTNPLCQAS